MIYSSHKEVLVPGMLYNQEARWMGRGKMVLDTSNRNKHCYYRHTDPPSTKPKLIRATVYRVMENLEGREYGGSSSEAPAPRDYRKAPKPHDDCCLYRQTDPHSGETNFIAAQYGERGW
jgi:hypothetical protein